MHFDILIRLCISQVLVDWVSVSLGRGNSFPHHRSIYRAHVVHALLAGAAAYVFSGCWNVLWLVPAVAGTRFLLLIVAGKGGKAYTCILQQALHLVAVSAVWAAVVSVEITAIVHGGISVLSSTDFLLVAFAYIIVVGPAGVIIGGMTEPWRQEIADESKGLARAGMWIGRLERIMILTFVLVGKFEAIGFLIAAKSVFRFSEIRSGEHRKEAEYILVGTMLSFVAAITVGILTRMLGRFD